MDNGALIADIICNIPNTRILVQKTSGRFLFLLIHLQPLSAECRPNQDLRVSYFARDIVFVDGRLLQEHMQAAFILSKRMSGDFVYKLL